MLKNVSANTAQHTINCTHSNARDDIVTNVCQTETHSKNNKKHTWMGEWINVGPHSNHVCDPGEMATRESTEGRGR